MMGVVLAAAVVVAALAVWGSLGVGRAHRDVERALRRWGLRSLRHAAWRTPFVLEAALDETRPMRAPRVEVAAAPAGLAWGARWVSADRREGRLDVLMDVVGRPRAELDLVRPAGGVQLPEGAVAGAHACAVGGWVCWTASEVGAALAAQIVPLLDEIAPEARRLRLRYILSPEFVLELPLSPREGAARDLDAGLRRLCAAAIRVPPGYSCKGAEAAAAAALGEDASGSVADGAAGSAAGSAQTQIQN